MKRIQEHIHENVTSASNTYSKTYILRSGLLRVYYFGYDGSVAVSRESAGAALRSLRESRDLSLADLAATTGVSIMGLSYLERGARKPHRGTVHKVENGLGLPAGTYTRLVAAADADRELDQVLAATTPAAPTGRVDRPVVVDRHGGADVLEGYAEAQLEALRSVIDRLPEQTSDEYETYIHSVVAQCVKAEMLAANSWRVAVNAGGESAGRLMEHLHDLEEIRSALLARLSASLGARFDRACRQSALPEAVIAALLGVTGEQIWDIRNRGVVPPGALPRIRAFADASDDGAAHAGQ